MQNNTTQKKRLKAVIIIVAVILVIAAGVLAWQLMYRNALRAEMNERTSVLLVLMNRGDYSEALITAQEARGIAEELRSDEDIETIDSYIGLIDIVVRADTYYLDEEYQSALGEYQNALLYASKSEFADAVNTRYIEDMAERAAESIYDYNSSLPFDLVTLIDRQRSEPASLVRMGTVGDRSEGWYNGCGWIATYNLLIKLDNPRHPADIVRYFEMTGGTVLNGVFGTYPSAIEDYLAYLGYDVKHTLFPQTRLSIDDEIKTAGVGIIAYMHTSAAHYVMIEYREGDGRFVVYNDAFARARSEALKLSDLSSIGAVIDSVEAWLAQTPDILFTFSLITP